MTRLGREHLGDMSDEGRRVTERRERLEMNVKQLAAEAGISRNTLSALESGSSFNRSTLAKVEKALEALEKEAGLEAPPPAPSSGSSGEGEHLVEYRVEGVLGVRAIVVKGPVEDIPAFEASIARILRQVQSEGPASDER